MTTSKRKELLQTLAAKANEHERRGDTVLQIQCSQQWYELATTGEVNRAPKYLTWYGRK
jgi:hypothetical protein